jgi:hypothetical protein
MLGQGVVVGLNVFVKEDLPPWSTVLVSGVKQQGEWHDPRSDGRDPVPPPELLALAPYPPADEPAQPPLESAAAAETEPSGF